MVVEFKFGDEVFLSYLDEGNIRRDIWAYFSKIGNSAVIVKTKSGSILLIPVSRILKIKKKSGENEII